MTLFICHDDPRNQVHAEERYWLAIWADRAEDAIDLYRRKHEEPRLTIEDVDCVVADPQPESPQELVLPAVDRRPLVLRSLGWYVPGDAECELCGLFEYDGLVPVCADCGNCTACGHQADCPANQEGLR